MSVADADPDDEALLRDALSACVALLRSAARSCELVRPDGPVLAPLCAGLRAKRLLTLSRALLYPPLTLSRALLARLLVDPLEPDAEDDGDLDDDRPNLRLSAALALLVREPLEPDDGDFERDRLSLPRAERNAPLARLVFDPFDDFDDGDLDRERERLSLPRNDLAPAFILVMLGLLTLEAALRALVLNPEKLAPICSATISRAINASWLRCRMRSPSDGSAISTRSMGTSNLTYSGW